MTPRDAAHAAPPEQEKKEMHDDEETNNEPPRLSLAESEAIIKWLSEALDSLSQTQVGAGAVEELRALISRVVARPAIDIYYTAWPDGSIYREKWLLHVWHRVPLDILSQACILAKEDTGPHYLMFMEPPNYQPKADFTCWICGQPTPHHHSEKEVSAARQTLKIFHDNVWSHLCEAQAETRKADDA